MYYLDYSEGWRHEIRGTCLWKSMSLAAAIYEYIELKDAKFIFLNPIKSNISRWPNIRQQYFRFLRLSCMRIWICWLRDKKVNMCNYLKHLINHCKLNGEDKNLNKVIRRQNIRRRTSNDFPRDLEMKGY